MGERRYLAMSMKVEETFSEEAALLIYSLRRRRRRELVELIPEDFCLESRSRREEETPRSQNNGSLEESTIFIAVYTGLGKRVVPRLRELANRGQRESGGRIHAT